MTATARRRSWVLPWLQADRYHRDGRGLLYVEWPDREGWIPVGITDAYHKDVTPREARRMAAALLLAAQLAEQPIQGPQPPPASVWLTTMTTLPFRQGASQ